jgi:adenine-specific DNA-methyltransferase
LGYESAKTAIKNRMIKCTPQNVIQRLYFDESDWELLPSLWVDPTFSAVTYGTNLLTNMFGSSGLFSFPKSLYTVIKAIYAGTYLTEDAIVLDYYGGSGTTAHAVMNINKQYGGNRKYIICEMGNYFDTVTRTRVEKAIGDSEWQYGKPVTRNGISQCFKYIRLEQYEDTLNNLEIKKQQTELQTDEFKESYMLSYMLDTETRDSLLNLKWFENPFEMTLKTTKDNELVTTNVDMVETFNYLIGLNVETEDWYQDDNICVVQGKTHRDGLKTLVIWRNCKQVDNKKLDEFFDRMDFRTRDTEFDIIYVNGDNTLPNLRRDEEHWKVVLTEEEFQKRMFEEV